MDGSLVASLLAHRPFRRFVIVTLSGHEYEVKSPEHYRVIRDGDVLFWTEDGTGDFLDLKMVERIRMPDHFGFAELDQLRT
jgi:hypothetical protein